MNGILKKKVKGRVEKYRGFLNFGIEIPVKEIKCWTFQLIFFKLQIKDNHFQGKKEREKNH